MFFFFFEKKFLKVFSVIFKKISAKFSLALAKTADLRRFETMFPENRNWL